MVDAADCETWLYQVDRVDQLRQHPHAAAAEGLLAAAEALGRRRGSGDFGQASKYYRDAALSIGHHALAATEPAARYDGMEEFWEDAVAQARGQSSRTFWDTYEHGHRRYLEALVAAAYGRREAVLVNCGMLAIDIAVRSSGLRPGDTLLAHDRNYFETGEYLNDIVVPVGIRVERRNISGSDQLASAISEVKPKAVLLESYLNGPELDPSPDPMACLDAGIFVILDNSLLSHGAWNSVEHDKLVVVELGLKYLCQRCSFGVVYGAGGMMRDVARRVGAQLQAAALQLIMPFEFVSAGRRVHLHGSRRKVFVDVLRAGPWSWVRDAEDAAARADVVVQRQLVASGGGALVFLQLDTDHAARALQHRKIMRCWRRVAEDVGLDVAIQAGFGWDWTSGRSYESNHLNRAGAGEFIRVSVGIGPESETARTAELLNTAAHRVLEGFDD